MQVYLSFLEKKNNCTPNLKYIPNSTPVLQPFLYIYYLRHTGFLYCVFLTGIIDTLVVNYGNCTTSVLE